VNRAKTAEPIEMPFEGADSCGRKVPRIKLGVHVGTTWRLRLNDPYAAGGDAALSQSTLVAYFSSARRRAGLVRV